MTNAKTALSFEEKITAAYAHYVRGVTQSDIALVMGGVDIGRVNEACMTIKRALMPDMKIASSRDDP